MWVAGDELIANSTISMEGNPTNHSLLPPITRYYSANRLITVSIRSPMISVDFRIFLCDSIFDPLITRFIVRSCCLLLPGLLRSNVRSSMAIRSVRRGLRAVVTIRTCCLQKQRAMARRCLVHHAPAAHNNARCTRDIKQYRKYR